VQDTVVDDPRPRLTIVTVNRNMRDGLRRTIASVRGQTCPGVEHLVVDGASTDGSPALLGEIAADGGAPLLRWLSEPDGGIYDAMNKGVRLARGAWLLFLNAGDELAAPDALAPALAVAEAGGAGIVYGDARIAYGDGSRALRPAGPIDTIVRTMPFAHAATLIRRDLLIERPYATDGQACDYAFFLACRSAGTAFRYVPGAIATVEAGGVSDRRRIRSTLERWHAVRSLGCGSPRLDVWYAGALLRAAVAPPLARLAPAPFLRRLRRARLAG